MNEFLKEISKLADGCHGRKPRNLATLLNLRENGFPQEDNLLLSILKGRSSVAECFQFAGNVIMEGSIVILPKERKIFNLESLIEFDIDGLLETDKIVSCYVDYPCINALNCSTSLFSVIILSEGGTLLGYHILSGKQIFKYQLPAGPKYKSVDTHSDYTELVVKASWKQTVTGSRLSKNTMVFALFNLTPFSFKHIFQIDDSVSNAFLSDNILTAIYSKPHKVELHFFPKVLKEFECYSHEERKVNVIPQFQITNDTLAVDIKGHYDTYDNVGDKFIMLIPHDQSKRIELRYLSQIDRENVVSGIKFASASEEESHLNIRQAPCAFTANDGAYTIYQFIGDSLVSYDLQRNCASSGGELTFTAMEMWRTHLTWNFGTNHESTIVTCSDFDFDDGLLLVSIVSDVNNMLPSKYSGKCEWKAALFVINRFTGSIERAFPLVLPSLLNTSDDLFKVNHMIHMENEIIISTFYLNNKTHVYRYSLSDPYQKQFYRNS